MQEQPQDIARIVELGEAEAYADFYASAPADFAARHGVRVERIGSAIALVPDSSWRTSGQLHANRRLM